MMVIPENLPPNIAPLAWLLGSWRGWGMLAQATDGPDIPVIEKIRADICGTHVRMVTTVYRGTLRGEIEPTLDAAEGLALIDEDDLVREETLYVTLLPGSGALPPPGEYEDRQLTASGGDLSGIAALWVGVASGPRIQMVTDTIARDARAENIEHMGRMYGLVGGEMMWTQERTMGGHDTQTDISGRLARLEDAANVSTSADE
ncbi:MAG: hypothetical protein CSA82_02240 [Actinobacteria bacterium]|nr:MAG: hypothetical protein CSA82_02240 [Actinomycetota bacterium]